MREKIINFKTAKLALKKGIVIDSEYFYTELNGLCNIVSEGELLNVFNDDLTLKEYHYDCNGEFWFNEDGGIIQMEKFPATTQSLLQRILRDEYFVDINIESSYNYTLSISKYEYYIVQEDCSSECEFNTYEEALEAALYETLELIEND